jgi:hypothetical protein
LDESGETQVFARLTGLETFTNLRIEVPGYTFDSLAFNVSGSSNLTVTGTFLNGETQTSAPVDLSSERGVLAYVLGDPNNLFDTNPLTSLLLSGGPFTSFSAFIITGVTAIPGVEPQPVPGPVAGAGLPALLALGGFVWARRRKAAAVA